MRNTGNAVIAALLLATAGCSEEEPTKHEQGRREAEDRLDYTQGAGEVLKDKGGAVGRVAGDGVGSLLRGLGSGVKDVVYPPIRVESSQRLSQAGITVNKCTEGEGSDVELTAAFSKIYKGRIRMSLFDGRGVEIGRVESKTINQPPGSLLDLTFPFSSSLRLGDVSHATLEPVETAPVSIIELPPGAPPAPVTPASVAETAADSGLSLGQLQEIDEVPPGVSLYVIFNRAFAGSIQLRAFDATDTEIGRSEKLEGVEYAADTSDTLSLSFNSPIDRASIARYALVVQRAKDKPKKGKKPL